MALFQEAIIKKHLLTLDEQTIENAFLEYKRVYSPDKIKNIRVAKEEQYQEGFIKEIFGSVLGYSVYPESPFNIETEKKNETNSKKADGAILKDEKVVGVIELKDNKTKNLDAVKDQAFGYKNNHKDCSYVISSNFHKLRFYIDDATDYEEFDLYNLDKETFKRFYLYLRKEGLLDKNLPKLLRQETKFHEEEISKKLYKDYSNFKRRFFENALLNNPQHDKLELFKKSQKFLDRILFLLFAEDKGLVGTNSIVSIVDKWSGADDDYYQPLYEMVNKYFGHLYRGYTYQKTSEVIPQFGGELFAPDELLESLKIDDEVLKDDLLILSKYDFNTDVDVNILGHIFEHSLNEVDDVEAELRGETLDKTKSKRKKDGVFYTPKYITKYIVDNTLGKLCREKKIELKLDEDIAIFEYQKADGKLNEKGKELFERLNTYRSWLLSLKVCDPACGSGAFLNQALSFFIEEHKFVDDIIAELTNTPLRLFDTDLQILENNIFGVDINEESVEIAKLSMWLRTAQPGRKLSDLSNNIKCGNSLIDDPAIAGDKAFNWEKEFPTVFAKGGFDVVIGNPPYVNSKGENFSPQQKQFFYNNYTCSKYQIDLYLLFNERAITITKPNFGLVAFIEPNSWLNNLFLVEIRVFLLNNFFFEEIVDTPFGVFKDATVDTIIVIWKNLKKLNPNIKISRATEKTIMFKNFISQVDFLNNDNQLINIHSNNSINLILSKLEKTSIPLIHISQASSGIKEYEVGKGNPVQTKQTISTKPYNSKFKISESYIKHIKGNDILNYIIDWQGEYLNYGEWIAAPRDPLFFSGERIVIREIPSKRGLVVAYTQDEYTIKNTAHIFKLTEAHKHHYFELLGILNSKLIGFYFRYKFAEFDDVFPKSKIGQCKELPISKMIFDNNQPYLADLVNRIYCYSSKHLELKQNFINYILSHARLDGFSGKIGSWHDCNFSEFIKELNKAIKAAKGTPLTKKDEFEWMELFEENKKKVLEIKTQIDQTQNEIDRMVYALYGLTEEEVQIVENS
jgi:type I restriction-modification system DNA methylase subunit